MEKRKVKMILYYKDKDGTVSFLDTKGVVTQDFKIKKKIIEDLYHVEIELWKNEK